MSFKRFLSNTAVNGMSGPSSGSVSNHQTFLQKKPAQKILDHLDHLGLGFVAKRKTKFVIKEKYQKDLPGLIPVDRRRSYLDQKISNTKQSSESPFPFHKGPRNVRNTFLAKTWEEVPDLKNVPEIAILGRSNVGKSTLVNALLGYSSSYVQKATVSNKPGETRALQLFTIGKHHVTKDPVLAITDMPGYGFALMNPADMERCFYLCAKYLRLRGKSLKRLLLVLDARHGFKYTDMKYLRDMISMTYAPEEYISDDSSPADAKKKRILVEPTVAEKQLLQNLSWKLQIVLTKCDLVERSILARRVQEIREDVIKSFPYFGKGGHTALPVMMISGLHGNGIVELQKELSPLVPPRDPMNSPTSSLSQDNKERKSHSSLIDDLSQAFTHLSSADILKSSPAFRTQSKRSPGGATDASAGSWRKKESKKS